MVCVQAKSQGNSDMIDRLDVRCRLVELQQRLVSNLEASSPQVRFLRKALWHPQMSRICNLSEMITYISRSTVCSMRPLMRWRCAWH